MQIQKQKHKNTEWINIINPDKSLVDVLRRIGIHPLHIEDILNPNRYTKTEQYNDYSFIISQFPVYNRNVGEIESTEIDIIVLPAKIITIHRNTVPDLNALFWLAKDNKSTQKILFEKGAGFLATVIIEKLLNRSIPMIDHFISDTAKLRQQVFQGVGKSLINNILSIQRNIIEFRRIFSLQSSVVKTLSSNTNHYLGQDFSLYFTDMSSKVDHLKEILEAHKEAIEVLRQAHDSLMRERFSKTVKILTVYSIITAPINMMLQTIPWNLGALHQIATPALYVTAFGFSLLFSITLVSYLRNREWY